MLPLLDLRGTRDLAGRLPRPRLDADAPVTAVRAILDEVRTGGDQALQACTHRYDGVTLDRLRVPQAEVQAALVALRSSDPALVEALGGARDAIEAFHRTQLVPPQRYEHLGMVVESWRQPVRRAGLYVPGGRAAYPSTVLMTAVPARVAGVAELVLCVPPGPDGSVAPSVLAAAALAGIDEVYSVGGAQAIAAMAFGTESMAPVDTISGPGNVYVALAKREVAGVVGVPSAFAGPSEVVVVVDATSPVTPAAVDLLVQAEHGPNGLAWLVTWEEAVAVAIQERVAELVATAPRGDDIRATLDGGGYVALVDDVTQAVDVVDRIAPEHLEVLCADPTAFARRVSNAGAIFCGPWAPASVGDYVAGPSHVLPTFGSARFASALTVDDFCKHMHTVTLDRAALERVGPWVQQLAMAEGLAAHADSVRLRLDSGESARAEPERETD